MWRRAAFLSLLAWLLAVGFWANRSWTESIPLVTPGVEGEARTFVCGAPLGARTVRAREPGEREYPPLLREPCDHHDERRALAVFDFVLGVAGLVVLAYFGTRHVAEPEPEPEPVAPVG